MLGAKLKELREMNGYVQRQIAAELEVDTAYISKVENDKDKASLLEDMEGINRQEEIVKKV